MKTEALLDLFEKHLEGEFLKFERIDNKLSGRRDIHAFILLDSLVPRDKDIVTAAEHDQIWLDVEPNELAPHITETQIIDLLRCGVFYDVGVGLSMYV